MHRHLPGGVLYDLYGPRPRPHAYDSSSESDGEEEEGERRRRMPRKEQEEEQEQEEGSGVACPPWRITVRFHDIPLDQASVCTFGCCSGFEKENHRVRRPVPRL